MTVDLSGWNPDKASNARGLPLVTAVDLVSSEAARLRRRHAARRKMDKRLCKSGLSAAYLAGPGNPDLPHTPEPDMAFYSPLVAGPARTNVLVGPVPSEHWDGSEPHGPHGHNFLGDEQPGSVTFS
jgi:hypothetical protein